MDEFPEELVREAARHTIAARPPDMVSRLLELEWPEIAALNPARATSILFEEHAHQRGCTRLLDLVMLSALEIPGSRYHVLYPYPGVGVGAGAAPSSWRDGATMRVDGILLSRPPDAHLVVVPVLDGGRTQMEIVDAATLSLQPVLGVCPEWGAVRATKTFRHAAVEHQPLRSWDRAVTAGRRALTHELQAAAEDMLEIALAHGRNRRQFGRPIGSFQVIKSLLADAHVSCRASRLVLEEVDAYPNDDQLARLGKGMSGSAFLKLFAVAQQILGATGFTWDHPFQQIARRGQFLEVLLGGSRTLRRQLGQELLGTRAAPRVGEL